MKRPFADDSLVMFGSAVKDLGNGRVGGFLVVFGDEDNTDATDTRDFFTGETDYDLNLRGDVKSTVYYDHGFDEDMGLRKLAGGSLEVKDAGVWIETQLALRDEYEEAIYQLVKDGKLGWSSGTATHLVERKKHDNGSHEITRWPLGLDASLTPTPAEPRTLALPLKSLKDARKDAPHLRLRDVVKRMGKSTETKGTETRARDTDSLLGSYVCEQMSMSSLSVLNSALYWAVSDMLYGYDGDQDTPEQKLETLKAMFAEYQGVGMRILGALIQAGDAGEMKRAALALKSMFRDPAAVQAEVKAGRKMSAANHEKLTGIHETMSAAMSDFGTMLKDLAPGKSGTSEDGDPNDAGDEGADTAEKTARRFRRLEQRQRVLQVSAE